MSALRLSAEETAALRAAVLLQRFWRRLARVAEQTLDFTGTVDSDLEVLLVIRHRQGASPSEVVAALGRPRSTVSRGVARLLEEGLLERRPASGDRRRAVLSLTRLGRQVVGRYEQSLTHCLGEAEPLVEEVMVLLGRPLGGSGVAGERLPPLDVADHLGVASAAFGRDSMDQARGVGAVEAVDRQAVLVLAQGRARPSRLSEELGLSPAGTTSMLDRLEGAGLTVRESGRLESDRRAVVVRLTPKGRRVARTLLRVFEAHQDALLDALEPAISNPRSLGVTG
jgi:DNA-binding MarR family transcriptional regulator